MKRSRAYDLIAPVAVFLAFLLPLRDGFTDDGFIHIQYARNIVTSGEYSFNPGEVSFGTSSPLWVLALAVVGRLLGAGETLIAASRVLSWLAGLAALAGVYGLALSVGARRFTAVLAACAFAADVWFARWTALSMESSTAVLAVVLMAIASVRWFDDRRAAALAGVYTALASLVRPEVYLAIPVFILAALTRWRSMNRRHLVLTLAVAAAMLLPWFAFAKLHIGRFIPNTAGAKSGGLVVSPLVLAAKLEPVAKVLGSSQSIAALALLASLVFVRARSQLFEPGRRFMLLWIVAVPVAYVVFDIQILSRYLLIVSPILCVLGWASLEELARRFLPAGARAPVLAAVAAVAIAGSAVFYARVVVPPSREFTHDLTHNMKGLAQYLDENAPDDAVVAAADIGYLAFYGRRRVLDLGGLVEPATGELRSRHTYEEIVERGLYFDVAGYPRVDYFVDRDLVPDRFVGRVLSGHRFEKVYETTVRNLGIRKPGPYYYVLYKLTPADE